MEHQRGGRGRQDDEVKRSRYHDDEEKNSSRRRSSRSRSRSPYRRHDDHKSHEKSRRHHDDGGSAKHSSKRHSPDRKDHGDRRNRHDRRRSRSPRRHNRQEDRGRVELRQQMARNYEEQLEKMRTNNQFAPPNQIVGKSGCGTMEPSKLVEQIEKRKALFKKDKPVESAATSTTKLWQSAAFSDDSDGKVSAKFQRLMGIKTNDSAASAPSASGDTETVKQQTGYLADLEKQYEVARTITHTQRGLGLGFGSRSAFSGNPKP